MITVEVPAVDLERLVEGYHNPRGFDSEEDYLAELEEDYMTELNQWDGRCRCGQRWSDGHQRQMVREAMQGIFLL